MPADSRVLHCAAARQPPKVHGRVVVGHTTRQASWGGRKWHLTGPEYSYIIPLTTGGAVAQLVERVNRTDEARGSNPLSSTIIGNDNEREQ